MFSQGLRLNQLADSSYDGRYFHYTIVISDSHTAQIQIAMTSLRKVVISSCLLQAPQKNMDVLFARTHC